MPSNPDYIQRLIESILAMHGCEAKHVATTPVKEVFRGKTVWEGEVETFELKDHPKAKRVYAWGHPNSQDEKKLEVTAVLEVLPVRSSLDAVRVAVAAAHHKSS